MSNWRSEKLGNLVASGGGKIHTGPFGSQLHASDYVDEGIPCVMPANMKGNRVDLTDIAFISEHDAKRLSKYIVQEGDLVYSRRGDVTQKALIRQKEAGYFCGTGCLLLRPGKHIDPKFLTYYLSTPTIQNWIVSQAVGATMPNLNTGILKSVPFSGPEKDVQEKISTVLTAIDYKIELNNRINSELVAMAKTLYDYWFVQFDFPDANGNPYKSSGGKMVYNAVLKREIPEGWKVLSLWNIASYFNGLAMQKYRPVDDNHLPVIKIKEMNEGISSDTEKARPDIPAGAIIDDGDVLFSWSATLDVKLWSQGKGALNQHIFKVTSQNYSKSFYFFELKNYLAHFKMMAERRKTTMGHITQDHLKQAFVSIPEKMLINRMDEKLQPVFQKQLHLHKENQHLTRLKDWLLPMLMNGQVTVK
ncbi:restriction endonuclease subunit S [Endozoicomonas acroporae]|uniref:restriction endonuclease subunit S n=1 Tax=Endozoicomonas acroporae TaxID=1701104 RepID=UPI0013D2A0AE|nr:restriction endonuclease subunit S [Endozoicomonas acroporae]